MHILLVTQYFWPENFRVNDLAAGLAERGHRVSVLTGIPNYPRGRFFDGYGLLKRRREVYRGCQVTRIPLVPRGNSRRFELALNYLSYAACATILAPWITDRSVDVILVCQLSPATVGVPAVVLKWLQRRPLVLWVLDLWPESLAATGAVHSGRLLRLVGRLVSAIYRASDLVLVSSTGFISAIQHRGGPAGHIHYFPNWVDVVEAPQPGVQPTLCADVPDDGFKVMFAGNIGQAQDFENILSAAERLREELHIHWLIVGDGRRRAWVEQQVRGRALQGTVHLLGSRPASAMPAVLSQADALLVTLAHDPLFALTAPAKLQSYLAAGKPIVGAIEGDGRRILEDSGAAVLCAPGDPDALADAVMTASRMPAPLRASMGESGRRYCREQFDREVLIDRFESWMQGAIASHAARRRSL
jgi:colanic acid biosynthesis glycosyl transferase WcaI